MRLAVLVVALVLPVLAQAADAPLEAMTATGDKVRLFPNGRWEYVDAKKAEAAKPAVEAYEKKRDAEAAAEQGGLFGIGRKIKPGDKDYNRGSLGGK